MGKSRNKTKPFIDKKRSSTYTLLHRTQAELALVLEGDHKEVVEEQQRDKHHRSDGYGDEGFPIAATGKEGNEQGKEMPLSSDLAKKIPSSAGSGSRVWWPRASDDTSRNHRPSSADASSSSLSSWRRRLERAGGIVLLEEEEGDRYLKEMGGGVFVQASGEVLALGHQRPLSSAAYDNPTPNDTQADSGDRLLFESVNLTLDCMDEDMQKILLFDDDIGWDGNNDQENKGSMWEELDDDFCIQASREPEGGGGISNEFDYDAHIRQLLERARQESLNIEINKQEENPNHPGAVDRRYFARHQAASPWLQLSVTGASDDHNDDYAYDADEFDEAELEDWIRSNGQTRSSGIGGLKDTRVSTLLSLEEERALCDKFRSTLAEYDDTYDAVDKNDDMRGDNDHDSYDGRDNALAEDEEALYGPRRPLEGDAELEAAMYDFLCESRDAVLMQGTTSLSHKLRGEMGGSGYSVLVGTRMVPAAHLNGESVTEALEEEPVESIDEILDEADATLAAPVQILTLESVITVDEFDGKSYFTERTRNPWDCESILSTYSNLDNNPAVIRPKTRRNKAKPASVAPARIELSSKTGLPIQRPAGDGGSPSADEEEQPSRRNSLSANKGLARNRNETKEEKRARKQAARRERHTSLLQKKAMRQAFGQELQKRSAVAATDTPVGSAVFRYS
jgi:protein LTV1